jgi:hypothetical protein
MEAFDLAVQNFKENGDQTHTRVAEQVFRSDCIARSALQVLSALAKRDPAKARKLSEQMPSRSVAGVAG